MRHLACRGERTRPYNRGMETREARSPKGSTKWPAGKTPRVILPFDASPAQRAKYRKLGYIVSTLTEKHLKIFRILHPILGHRFLPKNWIVAHFGTNSDNLGKELRDLMREPNECLFWPQQQNYCLNSGYKHGVYGLSHKGAETIGLPLPKVRHVDSGEGGGLFAHDLGVSFVECALKLGARESGIKFEMGKPQRYNLPTSQWEPDGHPISMANKKLFLPGIEFERRQKGGSPEDTDAKLDKIVEFMVTRFYESLGYSSALIPIISTTEARTAELMTKLADRTNGSCSYALFKTIPDWAREPHFPKPNGDMFTTLFARVGHPPLSLSEQLKGGAI